jgi:hypothetical protein
LSLEAVGVNDMRSFAKGLERFSLRVHQSCAGEEVWAFLGSEVVDEAADGAPQAFDGSLGGLSQMRLEFEKAFSIGLKSGLLGRR